MSIGCSSSQARKMLDASDNSASLQAFKICTCKRNDGLWCTAERARVHIGAGDVHIDIRGQIVVNAKCQQVLRSLLSLLHCHLWIASLSNDCCRHPQAI